MKQPYPLKEFEEYLTAQGNATRLKLAVRSARFYTPIVPSRGQVPSNSCLSFTLQLRWPPFIKASSAAATISLMVSDNPGFKNLPGFILCKV